MTDNTPSIQDIRDAFSDVKTTLDDFNATWPTHVRFAEVFPLDRQASNDRGQKPTAITVSTLKDEAAVHAALEILAALYREDGQNNIAITKRLPGLIALNVDPLPLIAPVNAAKAHLATLLDRYPLPPNPVSRHRAYKMLLGDVVIRQVLRLIRGLTVPLPYRLTFSWIVRSAGSRHLTPEQADALILRYHEARTSDARRPYAIEDDRLRLASIDPSDTLLVMKPVAPNPRLLVYPTKGESPNPTFPAPLPVFIYWPEGEAFPVFTPLTSLDIEATLATETLRAKKPRELIIPSIALFRQFEPI